VRIFGLIKKDIVQIFRDWKSTLFLIVMPILFTLFFGFVFSSTGNGNDSEDPRLPVGIFNQQEGNQANLYLLETLESSDIIRPVASEGDITDAEQQVSEGHLAAALIIPEGFELASLSLEEPNLLAISDTASLAGQTAVDALQTGLARLKGAVRIAQISTDHYADRVGFQDETERQAYYSQAIELSQRSWQNPPVQVELKKVVEGKVADESASLGFAQSSPGMMVQFAIFGLITSAMVLVLERKSGALKRLLTTPISKVEVIGGHTLAMFLIIFLQQAFLVLIGQFFFNVDYADEPLAILLMITVLAAWAASLGLLISAISKKEEQVIVLSLVAMFIFASLGGAWFPLEVAGDAFATIGHLMPTAWAMDGFQNIVVRGLDFSSVLLPAGILLGYSLVFFVLAVWRFQYE
jgi:ABC-2 type transport system permease protein